jgi:hypothetical protein
VERAFGHEAGAVDGTGVAGEDVFACFCSSVHFAEGGELGHGVGIVGRIGEHGRILAEPGCGEIEESASAERDDAAHAVLSTCFENVSRADDVHGMEVGDLLTRAAEQRGTVDGRVAARGGSQDILGVDDVPPDQLDADRRERRGFVRVPDQRFHGVAALDQLLADVGAGEAGTAGTLAPNRNIGPRCG